MEGDMTNPIPGYGDSLPDELTLGHIAWYSVAKPRLTSDDLIALVADLGLDPAIIPSPPRAGDAFKRACRYSERKGLPIAYSSNKANFLIRPVTQTTEDIERHLVVEVVDQEDRHLEYHDVAHMTFNRTDKVLNVAKKTSGESLDPLVDETLQMFAAHYKDAAKYIDAQVIRLMIRNQLDLMSAIAVRRQGSVYFIPFRSHKLTQGLEKLVSFCGPGSAFHSLPLIDNTKQREMVRAAFEEEVHEDATQLIATLASHKESGTKITPFAWNKYKNKFNALREQITEYHSLVDMELMKADSEMDALENQLSDFIVSGMIKTDE